MANNEEIEQLVNNICNTFVNKLEARLDKKFSKLSDKLSELSDGFKVLTEVVDVNKKAIQSIRTTADYLEQYHKRNTLRFHGLPESLPRGNDMSTILSFIEDKMQIQCTKNDIDSIFRASKLIDAANKPRSLIVNFVTNIKRNEVYSAKKRLKNSGVVVFEDLSKSRFHLLSEAKKKYGNRDVWTTGGKVYVLRENKKWVVNSVDDL
ncbi:hypothetical protein NQ315_002767 [Exocentrus adspersus]|uniref:Uncharacterized protein n=1 Tax=Exocentrus adspersus TaxID=1586481 RepID=A0AAV8VKI0_9CUCU|nr:hypothetical protein NQ315_002767 [Exocentrus adspersus]